MISSITIIWNKEEIISCVSENFSSTISDEDAGTVLEELEDNHDASIGINWDVIKATIEELLDAEKISLIADSG